MLIELQFDATPEQFQAVRRNFEKNGVDVPDEASGEIEQDDVKARFTYDGRTLRVSVYEKPWYAPESMVEEKLRDFIIASL